MIQIIFWKDAGASEKGKCVKLAFNSKKEMKAILENPEEYCIPRTNLGYW